MSIFMRQKWHDDRLAYKHLSNETMITLDSRLADSVWLPGLSIFCFGQGQRMHVQWLSSQSTTPPGHFENYNIVQLLSTKKGFKS